MLKTDWNFLPKIAGFRLSKSTISTVFVFTELVTHVLNQCKMLLGCTKAFDILHEKIDGIR